MCKNVQLSECLLTFLFPLTESQFPFFRLSFCLLTVKVEGKFECIVKLFPKTRALLKAEIDARGSFVSLTEAGGCIEVV